MAIPVIAVDGPSGTGKGTLCGLLAARLGWHLLDSGALYRLVGLAAERHGLDFGDAQALGRLAETLPVRFREDPGAELRVLLDGADVTDAIRSEACGNLASQVAVVPAVRAGLLALQRGFRRPPGLIADGRDMGTVVFPDAELKLFLTASPEERARRRHKQLIGKGNSVTLAQLLEDIARRDARDTARSVSPLKPASDAVVLDTTALSISEVEARVLEMLRQRRLMNG
jgi:cytidylate kinase